MDQRKRSKDEEDQQQRKLPRWLAWNKGRNETYNRTEKEKQFLDMNEVQQELDLLQDKDHTGKDDQTIEDKHKEEVQKVEEEDQKVEEEDQKEEEEVQKEEEEIQTGWVNYHEQTSSSSSSSSGDAKKIGKGGKFGCSGRATGGCSQRRDPLGGRSGRSEGKTKKTSIYVYIYR
jgi:hypothetical protein